MNLLFISHMPWLDSYGAATSLRWGIQDLETVSPHVHITVACPGGMDLAENDKDRKTFIDVNLRMSMNFITGFEGFSRWVWNLHEVIPPLKVIPKKLVDAYRDADVVVLNSLSLVWIAPLLREKAEMVGPPIISFMREQLLVDQSRRGREAILSLDGLIFIDEFTKSSYQETIGDIPEISLVLQNPTFQPTLPQKWTIEQVNPHLARFIGGQKFVYAFTGRVHPHKGLLRIAKGFRRLSSREGSLVVVGHTSKRPRSQFEMARSLFALRGKWGSFTVVGHVPLLSETDFYEKIDVLVRADGVPGAGRNVYEALEAGAVVILPGDERDYVTDIFVQKSINRVIFVTASDSLQMANAMRAAQKISRSKPSADLRSIVSGNSKYGEDLFEFLKGVC
jgi:glycosyltransferase involved in cell wall biosynthesis